jgi:dipeptidyl aminopeptidase/acylaminoacyl peptidase
VVWQPRGPPLERHTQVTSYAWTHSSSAARFCAGLTLGIALMMNSASARAAETWHLADIARVADIADLRTAGSTDFIFTVRRANLDAARYEYSDWRFAAASSAPPTSSPISDDIPSPDGSQLLNLNSSINSSLAVRFLGQAKPKVLFAPPQFTEIFGASWSPDGKSIAFVLDAGLREDAAWRASVSTIDPRAALTETYPQSPRQLWVIDVVTSARRQLTHDSLTYSEAAPRWTPDGLWLITTRSSTGLANDTSTQWVKVDVNTGQTVEIPGSTNCTDVLPSPSGARLASLCPLNGDPIARTDVIVDGNDLTAALDLNARAIRWVDDDTLIVLIQDGMAERLYRVMRDGRPPQPLTPSTVNVERFAVSSSTKIIAYVGSSETQPPEIYAMSSDGAATRQVSHINDSTNLPAAVDPKIVTWIGPSGKALSGLLFAPPGASLSTPLIVWVGGPRDGFNLGFDRVAQYFASHGYTVFEPNVRGSLVYGDWSGKALSGDWAVGPQSDSEAGIAEVQRLGVSSTQRRFLLGLKGGGYMSAWLVGHTKRFAAAVSGFGFTSLPLYYAFSNRAYIVARYFGEQPLGRNAQLLAAQSPISYVGQVTTPTLFLASGDDHTAPIEAIYPMYRELVAKGTPTILWRYAEYSRMDDMPQEWLNVYLQAAQWFAKYGGIKIDEQMPGTAQPIKMLGF